MYKLYMGTIGLVYIVVGFLRIAPAILLVAQVQDGCLLFYVIVLPSLIEICSYLNNMCKLSSLRVLFLQISRGCLLRHRDFNRLTRKTTSLLK